MKRLSFILIILLVLCVGVNAEIINIPDDFESIQGGIDASEDGDTVLVQPGEYIENIDFIGKDIQVGSLFLTTRDIIYINSTIINGDSSSTVVLFENGESPAAIFTGFTLQKGSGIHRWGRIRGGGIYIEESSPTISNCMISGNTAFWTGGGVFCSISDATIIKCTIANNWASAEGGGIYCRQESTPRIIDCNIENNSADRGGGIHIDLSCTPEVRDCNITGNVSRNFYGGGIYTHCSAPNIVGCNISRNSSLTSGGGVYIWSSHWRGIRTQITLCNISDNEGSSGGGIFCKNGANPIVRYCNISENRSTWYDGAGAGCVDATPEFINCTFARNSSQRDGGGMYCNSGSPILMNTIFWDNSPNEIYFRPNLGVNRITVSYSSVRCGEDGIIANNNGDVIWGDGNLDSDPLFIDPNEGDFHLTVDSPCIDAGNPELDPDRDGSRADIGAFYLHQRDITVEPLELNFPPINYGHLDSMSFTISNDGLTDLTIESIMGCRCGGCFWMNEFDQDLWEPIVIEPQQEVELWVYYRPEEGVNRERTIFILSDDPDEPEVFVQASGEVKGIGDIDPVIPLHFTLDPAYPNPFNSNTSITYSLPRASTITLKLYDLSGRMVSDMFNGRQEAGLHSAIVNADAWASGLYFVRLEAGGEVFTRKVMLVR